MCPWPRTLTWDFRSWGLGPHPHMSSFFTDPPVPQRENYHFHLPALNPSYNSHKAHCWIRFFRGSSTENTVMPSRFIDPQYIIQNSREVCRRKCSSYSFELGCMPGDQVFWRHWLMLYPCLGLQHMTQCLVHSNLWKEKPHLLNM